MSPISTAQLNPDSETYCIPEDGQSILIPVLLNNTNPTSVRYTLTPLGFIQTQADREKRVASTSAHGRIERFELGAKDLKAIENTRQELIEQARAVVSSDRDSDDYDEYDLTGIKKLAAIGDSYSAGIGAGNRLGDITSNQGAWACTHM